MHTSKKTAVVTALIATLVAGIVFVILKQMDDSEIVDTTDRPRETVTVGGITFTDLPEGADVVGGLVESDATMPALDRDPQIASVYQGDDRELMQQKIIDAQLLTAEDPSVFSSWLTLGILYSQAQDYTAAEEIYIFLNETRPTNSISFHNLGNLYALHLKDFAKAESNYRQALVNNASNETAYRSFHEHYRYNRNDSQQAIAILKEGIDSIPDSVDLRMLLASFYEEEGNVSAAKTYYEEAKIIVERRGNTALAETITALLESLE